jgi:hypothetical protein
MKHNKQEYKGKMKVSTCPSILPVIKSTKSFSLIVMVTSDFSAGPCFTLPLPFY